MKKILITLFIIGAFLSAKAQNEFQAKAFFVYNFTRLVEWPSNGSSEFVIGVIGNSQVTAHLENITKGKSVGSQKIVIKHFKSPEEIENCNIIYVSYGSSSKISAIQSSVKSHNTLIVAEKEGLVKEGAAINFVLNNNRLSFNINVDNAQKYGLKVSKTLVDMSS